MVEDLGQAEQPHGDGHESHAVEESRNAERVAVVTGDGFQPYRPEEQAERTHEQSPERGATPEERQHDKREHDERGELRRSEPQRHPHERGGQQHETDRAQRAGDE
jgi:hypothetical protein